ncbi:MAG: HAMP domain-containing protein, partial [Phormidium sp.]
MQHIYSYTKFTLIVGLLVTGIAVILALITVRWITQPIQRLHQAAQGIQSQKFDSINLEMVSKRPDEFGKLGKVFLGMVQVTYSREQNWQQLVQQLKSESSGSPILQNLTSKKGQIINLEQLLKKARSHRENISQSSQIDAND